MTSNLRVMATILMVLFSALAQAGEFPTWEQDGQTLPMGIRKVCIGDQYYLLVVDGGVPGGSWPRSITPSLANGLPEHCQHQDDDKGASRRSPNS